MLSRGTSSSPSRSSCTSAARRPSISRNSQQAINWNGCLVSPSLPLNAPPGDTRVDLALYAWSRKIDTRPQILLDVGGGLGRLTETVSDRDSLEVVPGEKDARGGRNPGAHPLHSSRVAERVLRNRAWVAIDRQHCSSFLDAEDSRKVFSHAV